MGLDVVFHILIVQAAIAFLGFTALDFALDKYPGLPILMIGGVCSNTIIRRRITQRYGAVFAGEGFSCDNAAGIAFLTQLKHNGGIG